MGVEGGWLSLRALTAQIPAGRESQGRRNASDDRTTTSPSLQGTSFLRA